MIYDLLAPIYDKVNAEIDYRVWADFVEEIFKREYSFGRPDLLLDLGCGTGKMTIELARRGYDMTGIDYSVEMLDFAREEAISSGVSERILWLCQDMREFELYGTVDAVVCCLDGINHLTDSKDLLKCFSLVHNYLIPGGIFIFDVNSRAKFETVYGERAYVMEEENSMCIWQNAYNKRTGICDFYITLFSEKGDGTYERFDECQREKMYTIRTLKKHLCNSGFEYIGAYSDFGFTAATDNDERIYVVAKCKK